MRVEWKDDAKQRLIEAVAYGEREFGRVSARKFFENIDLKAKQLATNPLLGWAGLNLYFKTVRRNFAL